MKEKRVSASVCKEEVGWELGLPGSLMLSCSARVGICNVELDVPLGSVGLE